MQETETPSRGMKIGVGVEPSVRLGVTADSNIQMVLGTAGASSWTLEGCWTTLQFMAEKLKTSAVIITLLTVFSGEALTEVRPNQIGSFKDWLVYSFDGDKSKVCYASSTPKASEPKNAKRDPAFLYVTSMPYEKPPVKGEVSTMMGYPLKDGQAVKLTIDGERFGMFIVGDTAWIDPGSDKKVVAAMKAGKSLQVEGTSSRGTRTVDTYSLDGFSDALAAVDKACN